MALWDFATDPGHVRIVVLLGQFHFLHLLFLWTFILDFEKTIFQVNSLPPIRLVALQTANKNGGAHEFTGKSNKLVFLLVIMYVNHTESVSDPPPPIIIYWQRPHHP